MTAYVTAYVIAYVIGYVTVNRCTHQSVVPWYFTVGKGSLMFSVVPTVSISGVVQESISKVGGVISNKLGVISSDYQKPALRVETTFTQTQLSIGKTARLML